MIKLGTKQEAFSVVHPPPSGIREARHLIVPVTSLDTETTLVARRLWDLAEGTGSDIRLVGLCNDPEQEPSLRRILVSLAAMVNYGQISAELEIVICRDWVTAVRSRCQPGDMVVCLDEGPAGRLRKPLSQLLQPALNVPLYILSDVSSQSNSPTNAKSETIVWIGFLAIILGFLVLQIRIYQVANDWQTTLGLISTVLEFWAIWKWSNLFN